MTQKNLLSGDEIRHGLNAYTLIVRETKEEFLSMYVEKVIKAFRLVNKSISELVLKKWYNRCKPYLECEDPNRIRMEKEYKENNFTVPFILPHEFLFLLCNSEDRLKAIEMVHRPELVSNKGEIHNFELI